MSKVNLDALIPREDFEAGDDTAVQSPADKLPVRELVKGGRFFFIRVLENQTSNGKHQIGIKRKSLNL